MLVVSRQIILKMMFSSSRLFLFCVLVTLVTLTIIPHSVGQENCKMSKCAKDVDATSCSKEFGAGWSTAGFHQSCGNTYPFLYRVKCCKK